MRRPFPLSFTYCDSIQKKVLYLKNQRESREEEEVLLRSLSNREGRGGGERSKVQGRVKTRQSGDSGELRGTGDVEGPTEVGRDTEGAQ